MNEAVKRFLDETGARYAEQGDRDTSPVLFKADDENGGTLFELSLPKGEPHPYWCVREREMTAAETAGLIRQKTQQVNLFGGPPHIGYVIMGTSYTLRGYVYNARKRNEWAISVDGASVIVG